MKKYTITEYADKIGKTREAVFYQIKKKKIKARKNKNNEWEIFTDNESKKEEKQNISNDEILNLKIKVAIFEEQKKVFEEKIKKIETELKNKDALIKAKEEIIEAERRTNIALISTIEHQKILLEKPKKNIFQSLKFWK